MKCVSTGKQDELSPVAPLVGAWIEIRVRTPLNRSFAVAPLVGAWIEMQDRRRKTVWEFVAPLVGAWIEMWCKRRIISVQAGRSPCGSVD